MCIICGARTRMPGIDVCCECFLCTYPASRGRPRIIPQQAVPPQPPLVDRSTIIAERLSLI
jgi:hypothetical protein